MGTRRPPGLAKFSPRMKKGGQQCSRIQSAPVNRRQAVRGAFLLSESLGVTQQQLLWRLKSPWSPGLIQDNVTFFYGANDKSSSNNRGGSGAPGGTDA